MSVGLLLYSCYLKLNFCVETYSNELRRKPVHSIERIVLLDFIHRLVSQKTNKIEELKKI
jgi:hypothetical protein